MKRTLWLGLISMMAVACRKPPPEPPIQRHPSMVVKDLADSSVALGRYAHFDLDNNGQKDVLFSTQSVGYDNGSIVKQQWTVNTSFYANLPVNSTEQIPVLQYLDSISINDFSGYAWYNASSIVLSQKIYSFTAPPFWEGDWKESYHCFVPVQLVKQDGLYNGWIEVSFSTTTEKLTLHRMAICKEANKSIIIEL